MSKIFSQEIINTDRQHVFDLCKAICVVGMIITHIFYILDMNHTAINSTGWLYSIGNLFGAQLFMFSMGVGMAYTRHNTPRSCCNRGVILFLTGYLLNFLRETLPWLIVGESPFISSFENDLYTSFLRGDILQFAGLAFLFVGVLKFFKLSNLKILLITILITLFGAFCSDKFSVQLQPDNLYFLFVGLIVPIKNLIINEYVAFCFSNWVIYPVLGLLFGEVLKHCYNKKNFYASLLKIFAIILGLTILGFKFILGQDLISILIQDETYYQQPLAILPIYLMILMFGVCLAYFVSQVFIKTSLWRVVQYLSKELPTLYIVSWVLIGWIGGVFRFYNVNLPCDYKNIFLIFVIIMFISEIYIYLKNIVCKKEL